MIEPLIVDKKRAQVDIITNYLLPSPIQSYCTVIPSDYIFSPNNLDPERLLSILFFFPCQTPTPGEKNHNPISSLVDLCNKLYCQIFFLSETFCCFFWTHVLQVSSAVLSKCLIWDADSIIDLIFVFIWSAFLKR